MVSATLQPAVAYLRRSTDRQEQSLGDQRSAIRDWAEEHGYRIIDEYVDDAVSGTSARKRTGFQQMIADAQNGGFVAIVVWNSDRFSRGDVTETEHYRFVLREAGVNVLSVTEDYMGREGLEGDLLRTIRQSQNRQYSVSLSQNTLRGQLSAVKDSADPGRMPPYGYDREIQRADGTVLYRLRFLEGGDRQQFDRDGRLVATFAKGESLNKPSSDCRARLVPSSPERVKIIQDIFAMCAKGMGFKAIADELNRRGLPSPRGRLWQHTSIKAILANPAYQGDLVWNRRTEGKFYSVKSGRADHLKPSRQTVRIKAVAPEDWITIENAHEALVDRQTWQKAQVAATGRAEHNNGRGKQIDRWLLSGIMVCGCCGQPFWGQNKKKGRGKNPTTKKYYICSGRCKHGKSICPESVHVPAEMLEAWVIQQVRERIFLDGETVDEAVERFVRQQTEEASAIDVSPLERELKQIEDTVKGLITNLDPANLNLVNGELTRLRKRRETLLGQIQLAKAESLDEKALRSWARERLSLLEELADGRRDELTRQAIASYVDQIIIDPATKSGVLILAGAEEDADAEVDGPDDASEGNPLAEDETESDGSESGQTALGPEAATVGRGGGYKAGFPRYHALSATYDRPPSSPKTPTEAHRAASRCKARHKTQTTGLPKKTGRMLVE